MLLNRHLGLHHLDLYTPHSLPLVEVLLEQLAQLALALALEQLAQLALALEQLAQQQLALA
jgi:hypothetical protein